MYHMTGYTKAWVMCTMFVCFFSDEKDGGCDDDDNDDGDDDEPDPDRR